MERDRDAVAGAGIPLVSPEKGHPPGPATLVAPTRRKWTGTLPDKFVAALVELVSTDALRETVEALASFHTRHTFSPLVEQAAEEIANRFKAAGYSDVTLRTWSNAGHSADNVICTKPGTDAGSPVIILCGHYDSRMENLNDATARAPGADDNASGVAAILEIARLLEPVALTSTVRFVAFSGEEQGLWGATAYAAELHAAGAQVFRVVNLDMVGRPPADGSVTVERDIGNAVAGNDAASLAFGAVMAQAAADYTTLPVKLGHIYSSDYMPFEAHGDVTIGAYEGEGNPHYHRTTDAPATLDYGYLADVTRITLATLLAETLEAVDEASSAVDLYIRDNPTDTGAQPSGVQFWTSPDIWVRNNDISTGDDPELGHEAPINDRPNYLYVRVHNRGTAPAAAGVAEVRTYRCDPGTGMMWPTHFQSLGTSVITAPIPAGGSARVGPFVWTPQIVDHECLLAIVSAPGDHAIPDIYPGELNHGLLARFDNNVGQRNVAPQMAAPGGKTRMTITLRGGLKATDGSWELDASALPEDTRISVRTLSRMIEPATLTDLEVKETGAVRSTVEMKGGKVAVVDGYRLDADDHVAAEITIDFSHQAEHMKRYPFVATQYQDGAVVGRMTIQITAVKELDDFFFGNPRSGEIHVTTCPYWPKLGAGSKVPFMRIEDALARGYNGCAYCLPQHNTG
ncbi:M28 family peptidase [Streptomyces gardneri]|uniref:M28 family metallopeptidase n=1 Tax=Streptomyces gardneri TaxID=66892 RepID=UPI0006BD17F8|nr:M28 family peptidase [Streptomyces gardneri]QPK44274.1 M28 family peptidase [Streptomyces gardneri]WRK35562.1 M28 family peptidase [Streptomyces venezuelae]CUM42807.1 Aminopeptidase Y (Arg, Lys, Leu preference) [Streptomyces venezuelae]